MGVGYGHYAAGVTAAFILRELGECIGVCAGELLLPFCIALGAILAVAAAIGFVGGIIYGSVMGAWHCAMDFYNQGFCRGLSSPFRFLHAKIMEAFYSDNTKMIAYYESVDRHFLSTKESITPQVKKIIEAEVIEPVKIVDNVMRAFALAERKGIERGIVGIIAGYYLDFDIGNMHVPRSIMRTVADTIESHTASKPQGSVVKISQFFSTAELCSLLAKHSFLNSGKGSWDCSKEARDSQSEQKRIAL